MASTRRRLQDDQSVYSSLATPSVDAGVLDDKRADFHRRKESLEKLETQLADYQALLEEEDREATERLESAIAASRVGAFDSYLTHDAVGGLVFDFGAVRTASSDRDAPRRRNSWT